MFLSDKIPLLDQILNTPSDAEGVNTWFLTIGMDMEQL